MGEIVGGKITCVFFSVYIKPQHNVSVYTAPFKKMVMLEHISDVTHFIFTGRPFTITSPEVGSIRPHIMDRSVDLPQPDGPTMDMNCPFFTDRLIS